MKKVYLNPAFPHFLHGGDYNPDQWSEYPEVLSEDMRLMQLANCNEMSIGIFSWATLEPREGEFDFSFLDDALDRIYAAGGRVMLATPSGARPAWLAAKYPEVLRVNARREKQIFGERHNHCYTSPVYREKTALIDRLLAERYKDHPALIAWHISNEYGGECHCPLCQEAFRNWLKDKYGTLDRLNHEWWTRFWSHRYTDWSQIESPSPIGESSVHGLALDWKRFVTYQTTDFMKTEIAAVRSATPDIPVTTNLMSFFPGLDYRVLAKELDFVSEDAYPAWSGKPEKDIPLATNTALVYDLLRSLKHRPFALMESTPSIVNWAPVNKLKRPGMHMLVSMQAVAHGSDSVQYFQWRKSRGSSEKLHGAVVDHVGNEHTRVFRDVSEVGARLKKLDSIVGTATEAKAAILYDWSNRWALDAAQGFQNRDKKMMPTLESFYAPLWKRGIDTDVVGPEDDFSRYSLLIAPMLYMADEKLIDRLADYVRGGGTLVCTYMTGMVGENDLCHLGGFPGGKLKEVFGIWNEEIDSLYPDDSNTVRMADGSEYKAVDYCELIHAQGAETLGSYAEDFYAGMPAVTVNRYGGGRAYYIAFRDDGSFADSFIARLLDETGVRSGFDGALPHGVTAHTRTDGGNRYVFLQNFGGAPVTLSTGVSWSDAESGEAVSGEFALGALETKILRAPNV